MQQLIPSYTFSFAYQQVFASISKDITHILKHNKQGNSLIHV